MLLLVRIGITDIDSVISANFDIEVVKKLPASLDTGIYYGWAKVDTSPVYKMVVSIGWNPYYDNQTKSVETHIIHDFKKDLYGSLLKVCICGYLRPEKNFESLEKLIEAINGDIKEAEIKLESEENINYKNSVFFE